MDPNDRDDLIDTILRGTLGAMRGDTLEAVREIAGFAVRSHERAQHQAQQRGEIDAAFFGPAPAARPQGETVQPGDEDPPIGSTCTGCGLVVARNVQRCPRCGGIAFLDPIT